MNAHILGTLLALWILPAAAQAPDAVSGKWGGDGATFLDLKYDGKGRVTGTVVWRGDGKEATFPIKSGTFDPKKNAVALGGTA